MVVADTHILAWYLEGNKKLPTWAVELMDGAILENALLVSSMTVYEMGVLLEKRRVEITCPVKRLFDDLIAAGLVVEPVDYAISLVANKFDMIHRDPIDRLIMATSVVKQAPLITADREIFKYPLQLLKV